MRLLHERVYDHLSKHEGQVKKIRVRILKATSLLPHYLPLIEPLKPSTSFLLLIDNPGSTASWPLTLSTSYIVHSKQTSMGHTVYQQVKAFLLLIDNMYPVNEEHARQKVRWIIGCP